MTQPELFDALPEFPVALPDDELALLARLPEWPTSTEIDDDEQAACRRLEKRGLVKLHRWNWQRAVDKILSPGDTDARCWTAGRIMKLPWHCDRCGRDNHHYAACICAGKPIDPRDAKIESDAKVIAALRGLAAIAKKILDAGQRAEDMHPVGSHAHELVLGTTLTSHWTLTKMVLTELIAAAYEQNVGESK